MTDIAFANMFTGAVILVWGFRALRKQPVNVLFFKMRGIWSTWVFGFLSVVSGLLMLLSGLAATESLTAELAEVMAISGLVGFATAWIISLIVEGIGRMSRRLFPEYTSQEARETEKVSYLTRRKRKPTPQEDDIVNSADSSTSLRKLLQTSTNMFLLIGSQVYSRIMTPPRHWDKQNLWNADGVREQERSPASETLADADREDLFRESDRAATDFKALNVDDRA